MVIMEHMAVFDTNILIDLFNNRMEAADAIESTATHRAISLITWMEVLVGARKYGQEAKTAAVMSAFEIIDISREIAERSVLLRVKHGMKLPDAIILATAQSKNCQLISRNTKDFAGIAGVISPYQL
jgi:hypothetical protein